MSVLFCSYLIWKSEVFGKSRLTLSVSHRAFLGFKARCFVY